MNTIIPVSFRKILVSMTLLGVSLSLSLQLSGCAAVHTAIAKKDLDVQTRLSDSLFLEPSQNSKTLYVAVHNTAGVPLEINAALQQVLAAKGYRIAQDPAQASLWLRANILSIGKSSPSAAQAALGAGYGGPLTGLALGSTIGGAAGGWAGFGGVGGMMVGGLLETVADATVKDVTYLVVTDLEIAEQTKAGVKVQNFTHQSLQQGHSGATQQSSSETSDRKKYRTRIVSTANQVNLDYPEAEPALAAGLVRTLAGIF